MNRKLILIAIAAPVLVGVALLLYTWPTARSAPRDIPVGVVAAPQTADSVVGSLQAEGDALRVTRFTDTAAARDAIEKRQIDAAVVTTRSPGVVLTASAASPVLTMRIEPLLTKVAGRGATVTDVVATPADDPKGSVLAAGILPLTLAGQLTGILLALTSRPGHGQLAVLVVVSAVTGVVGWLISGLWLDVLGGTAWWLIAGVYALTVLAIGCIVVGLNAVFGRAGLPVAFGLLVFLGNAFAGTNSAPELLPPAARHVGQWLPPGAGNELLRSVAFFHGHGSIHPIVVLGVWVVLGVAASITGSVLAARRTQSGRHERDGANPVLQPAAG